MSSRIVPPSLKHAHVTSISKEPSMEKSCLEDHRPIFFLPFFSKVLERVVGKQLTEHLKHKFIDRP